MSDDPNDRPTGGRDPEDGPGDPQETPSLRLDDVLKFFGLATTGGHAKQLIQSGAVRVNGQVETRRKRRLHAGDAVQAGDEAFVVEFEPNPEA